MSIRLAALALSVLTLHGCSEPAGDGAAPQPSRTGSAAIAGGDEAQADIPSQFIRTAWRVIAEDGARYVTYLDEGGRYRDLRNGDPWQVGTWEIDGSDRLCFLPDAEGAVLRCWHPDRMQGRDAMIATGEDDLRIRVERADYSPPADPAEADEEAEAGETAE